MERSVETGVGGVLKRLERHHRGGCCTHISELVVTEVGFVALEKLHSQVAVQAIPLLQIQMWFRAHLCPMEQGWARTQVRKAPKVHIR